MSVFGPLGASVGRLFGPLEQKFRGERAKWGPSGIRSGQSWPELARVGQGRPGSARVGPKAPSVYYPTVKAYY